MNTRDSIFEWLTECQENIEEGGGLAAILLFHFDSNNRENDIFSIKTGHAKWGNAQSMADAFYKFAQRHAAGLIGAQQFSLNAVYGEASGKATRFLPFGMSGALHFGSGPGGGLSTEPPTPTGQMSQGMRMGEIVVQGMIGQINPTFRVQAELIDRLMRYLTESESDKRELWIACKNLLMELQKEKHADKMKELMAARMTEFGKNVITLAPALINMMASREVFPLSTADTAILDFIASVASPSDVAMMQQALMAKGEGGKEIAVTLADRFQSYHKRKAEEAVAEKRLMDGLPSRSYEEAELDAAGLAVKALRGQDKTPSMTAGAVKALMNASEPQSEARGAQGGVKANGSAAGHPDVPPVPPNTPPREGFNVAEAFLADLFEQVPREKIEMVIGVLGVEQPKLAETMRELLVKFKS